MLKTIKIWHYTKIYTIMAFLIGLLLGILYSFGGLIIDILVSVGWMISTETPGLSYGSILAFGALIAMPLISACFGFLIALIGGFLYNLVARCFST